MPWRLARPSRPRWFAPTQRKSQAKKAARLQREDKDRRRKAERELNFKPIPSPIHDLDYVAEPSVYETVGDDHYVLTTDSGY